MSKDTFIVGITLGDPNGIGPEVVLKALSDTRLTQVLTPVVYGSEQVLAFYQRQLALSDIGYSKVKKTGQFSSSSINLVDCLVDSFEVTPGKGSKKSAGAACIFLRRSVEDLQAGFIDGLVTGPIDKNTIYGDGFPYRGHTEYLAQVFNTAERLMMMVDNGLRLGLATEHTPIKEVANAITSQRVESKIEHFEHSLKQDFRIAKPHIAVLGLNPHAGDGGLIGTEEDSVIAPVVRRLRHKGTAVFGPFAADGFFASGRYKQYDGILAMYHDQGLIPFKLLAFENGVNYTAGLPVVRTSPDHGTAYDIAGKNKANENALKAAIYLVLDIMRNRNKTE